MPVGSSFVEDDCCERRSLGPASEELQAGEAEVDARMWPSLQQPEVSFFQMCISKNSYGPEHCVASHLEFSLCDGCQIACVMVANAPRRGTRRPSVGSFLWIRLGDFTYRLACGLAVWSCWTQ